MILKYCKKCNAEVVDCLSFCPECFANEFTHKNIAGKNTTEPKHGSTTNKETQADKCVKCEAEFASVLAELSKNNIMITFPESEFSPGIVALPVSFSLELAQFIGELMVKSEELNSEKEQELQELILEVTGGNLIVDNLTGTDSINEFVDKLFKLGQFSILNPSGNRNILQIDKKGITTNDNESKLYIRCDIIHPKSISVGAILSNTTHWEAIKSTRIPQ